jgi:site-specific DNA recombinase
MQNNNGSSRKKKPVPKPEAVKCAIFGRSASSHQSAASLDNQIRECSRYAKQKGWRVMKAFVRACAGVSGRSLADCKCLQSLLQAAKGNPRPFDCVLVTDVSRLGRNLSDVLKLTEILRTYGVSVHSVDGHLNTRDPTIFACC